VGRRRDRLGTVEAMISKWTASCPSEHGHRQTDVPLPTVRRSGDDRAGITEKVVARVGTEPSYRGKKVDLVIAS
jgi:hypothetical protein